MQSKQTPWFSDTRHSHAVNHKTPLLFFSMACRTTVFVAAIVVAAIACYGPIKVAGDETPTIDHRGEAAEVPVAAPADDRVPAEADAPRLERLFRFVSRFFDPLPMHADAFFGRTTAMRALPASDLLATTRRFMGSCVHFAALGGSIDALKECLRDTDDLTSEDPEYRKDDFVRHQLLNYRDQWQHTVTFFAAWGGNVPMMMYLQPLLGGDGDDIFWALPPDAAGLDGILKVIIGGSIPALDYLIETGRRLGHAPINFRRLDRGGRSLCNLAYWGGSVPMVKYLEKVVKDLPPPKVFKGKPRSQAEFLEMLEAKSPRPCTVETDSGRRTLCLMAAFGGGTDAYHYCEMFHDKKDFNLDAGYSNYPSTTDSANVSTLMYAAWGGSPLNMRRAIAREFRLFKWNASLTAQQLTKLISENPNASIADLSSPRLERPTDDILFSQKDRNGNTVCHHAAVSGSIEAIRFCFMKLGYPTALLGTTPSSPDDTTVDSAVNACRDVSSEDEADGCVFPSTTSDPSLLQDPGRLLEFSRRLRQYVTNSSMNSNGQTIYDMSEKQGSKAATDYLKSLGVSTEADVVPAASSASATTAEANEEL